MTEPSSAAAAAQILHVEQEAVGEDTTVINAVLECDVERTALLQEEKELLQGDQVGHI